MWFGEAPRFFNVDGQVATGQRIVKDSGGTVTLKETWTLELVGGRLQAQTRWETREYDNQGNPFTRVHKLHIRNATRARNILG